MKKLLITLSMGLLLAVVGCQRQDADTTEDRQGRDYGVGGGPGGTTSPGTSPSTTSPGTSPSTTSPGASSPSSTSPSGSGAGSTQDGPAGGSMSGSEKGGSSGSTGSATPDAGVQGD